MEFQFFNERISTRELLRKKKAIKRKLLLSNPPKLKKRLYILSGSTIGEIADQIQLFTLRYGVELQVGQGGYGRFFEEAVFEWEAIQTFQPDFIYIHTSSRNVCGWPDPYEEKTLVEKRLEAEFDRFCTVLDSLLAHFSCPIIINNFEPLPYRLMGNKDIWEPSGRNFFLQELNRRLTAYVQEHPGVYLQDAAYLASCFGLRQWSSPEFWYRYKYALSLDAIPFLCHNLSNILKSLCGCNHKCAALDLDGTLWGGVVGDDGMDQLQIGAETAEGEAFTAFQAYLKDLTKLGVVLAVVSKNEEDAAKQVFSRSEMVLSLDDIASFCANWEAKSENLKKLSLQMNLGLDSFVFVDDNPAERQEIRMNAGQACVVELDQPEQFLFALDDLGCFECTHSSQEDKQRTQYYQANQLRQLEQDRFTNYKDYLNSLHMDWQFSGFDSLAAERIVQLINKTNQFNLTTLRLGLNEVKAFMDAQNALCFQGKMSDKFGDNGIVTLFIGEVLEDTLFIRLWVMSCRVFKRNGEFAFFEYILQQCRERGVRRLVGRYVPTEKNRIVKDFYPSIGFRLIREEEGGATSWERFVSEDGEWNEHA